MGTKVRTRRRNVKLDFWPLRVYAGGDKEDIMGVSSIGPSGLDPFTSTPPPAAEESRESVPDQETREAPLPEGAGTVVDTSA